MTLIALPVLWLAATSALCNLVLWAIVVGINDKNVKLCFGRSTSVFNILMFLAAIANAAIVLLYLLEWNH
nr:MAG TPA: hypothetical protein [Caudoviricetes sp.]